jgi:hypothetical protein
MKSVNNTTNKKQILTNDSFLSPLIQRLPPGNGELGKPAAGIPADEMFLTLLLEK